jgi:hypothetical protein
MCARGLTLVGRPVDGNAAAPTLARQVQTSPAMRIPKTLFTIAGAAMLLLPACNKDTTATAVPGEADAQASGDEAEAVAGSEEDASQAAAEDEDGAAAAAVQGEGAEAEASVPDEGKEEE